MLKHARATPTCHPEVVEFPPDLETRIILLSLQSRAIRHWALTARTYALVTKSGTVGQLRDFTWECQKAEFITARTLQLFKALFPKDKAESIKVLERIEFRALIVEHDGLMEDYEACVKESDTRSPSEKLLALAGCRSLLRQATTVLAAAKRIQQQLAKQ